MYQARLLDKPKVLPLYRRPLWQAAAAVIIIVFAAWFLWKPGNKNDPPPHQVATISDVPAPAANRATITLANGQRVFLDSAANGALATQGAVRISKQQDGQITYTGTATDSDLSYNTLFNPRGSKVVTLVLSDGTQVWLNAESSVRYPAAFTGNDRKVEITGEAYFEVVHDPSHPFLVSKGGMEVKVLGTHFNVNAYNDEPNIKVTLIEGRVQVTANQQSQIANSKSEILSPRQQAIITNDITLNRMPDIKQVLAWKNGAFDFAEQDFATSMRQLERWYNIKVVYDGAVPKGRFWGKIGRDLTLMQVVKEMDGMVATFRFENNQLHILP